VTEVMTFSKTRFEVTLYKKIILKNRHFQHRLEIEVEEKGSHHVAGGEMRLAENTALHTLSRQRPLSS
jgi:hypothetical protein